jgi:hypothetical protein
MREAGGCGLGIGMEYPQTKDHLSRLLCGTPGAVFEEAPLEKDHLCLFPRSLPLFYFSFRK